MLPSLTRYKKCEESMKAKIEKSAAQIGQNIRSLRKKKSINQTELAKLLCVSPQAVSKWELGLSAPDAYKLPELAKTLNASIDDLFDGCK